MPVTVRDATADDAAACAEIYAPYVRDTVVSFELDPPSAQDLAARIAAAHAWLVADVDGTAAGYAYAGTHRDRPAYRYACDVSVYVAPEHQGAGIGTMLYEELLRRVTALGFHTACAGVAQPNPSSMALHRRLGFRELGTYEQIGRKFDAWHDVTWLQLRLADADADPDPGGQGRAPSRT